MTISLPNTTFLKGAARASAVVSGAESGEYVVEWFLDGASAGTGDEMTFPLADYGTHDVKAVVSAGAVVKESDVKSFAVRTDIAYVNNTGNGTYPYASPLTATNDLAEAINAVWTDTPDPRVSVAAESVALSGNVTISQPVRIFGEGADKTRLTCTNNSGTAITINNANCKLTDLTIADGRCRAVDMRAGEMSRCIVTNFSSPSTGDYSGLGVRIGASELAASGLLRDCEIVDCRLSCNYGSGGGIYIWSMKATVMNCTVRNCYANELGTGGGIYNRDGQIYSTRIIACGRDDSSMSGAALYLGAAGFVRNCVIMGTRQGSSNCSVVQINGDWGAVMESCTIAGNGRGSAAVHITDKSITECTVRNTVVHGNATTKQLTQSAGTVTYCCYDEATEGENGNRVASGRIFTGCSRGCYYPLPSSPCFNGGLYQSWMAGATDIEGNPRICHGRIFEI